jgi:hypothetical protein
MRRFVLAGYCLAMLLPLAVSAAVTPKPLIAGNLLGTYSCSGKDVTGHALSGRIGWTYADGTALMFFARLQPRRMITFIDETWELESPDTGYVAHPNPNSLDTAMWRSAGWRNGKLGWARMAAQSMMSRQFTVVPGGVTFAVATAGDEAKSIGYRVRCKRLPKGG